MQIVIKRVYDEPNEHDGTRVLVDRLWPRGLKREAAQVAVWAKDLAPSPELRKWFNHEPDRFTEFARQYREQLDDQPDVIDAFFKSLDRRRRLTLLYAARDPKVNHAAVLQEYLKRKLDR